MLILSENSDLNLFLPLVFCVFDKSAAILRIRIKALAAGPYLYMGVTNFILYCHCTPYSDLNLFLVTFYTSFYMVFASGII
jgi:hypothetical protein